MMALLVRKPCRVGIGKIVVLRILRSLFASVETLAKTDIPEQGAKIYLASGLFDPVWYLDHNADVRAAGLDPLGHYLASGWREGRDPSPYFSTSFYLANNFDVVLADVEPLQHYILTGAAEARHPNVAFDNSWYRDFYPDVGSSRLTPLQHFLEIGIQEGRWPHPLCDLDWFRCSEACLAGATRLDAFQKIISSFRTARANEFFDSAYYLKQVHDGKIDTLGPFHHFQQHGGGGAANPGPNFDVATYLDAYDDVKQFGMNPLTHYLHYGRYAGRTSGNTKTSVASSDIRKVTEQKFKLSLRHFLASGARLTLPTAEMKIDVSIILVLFNKAYFTLRCLESLSVELREFPWLNAEIIVFDNGSTDETAEMLERVSGLTLVPSTENLGFLRAVNLAAKKARGRTLLLLNNDTELAPGAIADALRLLDGDVSIGAVGGRLILPDGLLQEAGSVIFNEGSCLGLARGRAANDPMAMVRRDVDYCSGAFLLTPMSLWRALDGFDEVFAPAYYEESDYCLRLQKLGKRVVYNPSSVIFHFEFGSSYSAAAAMKLQERNKVLFAAKHAGFLASRPPPSLEAVNEIYTTVPVERRILVVDDRIPYRWLGFGLPRARHIIQTIAHLVDGHGSVTLLTTNEFTLDWDAIREVLPDSVEIVCANGNEIADFITHRLRFFGKAVVSRPHNYELVTRLIESDVKIRGACEIIYDAEAIFAIREIRKQEVFRRPLAVSEQDRLLKAELELASKASAIITVSEKDAQVFAERLRVPVTVLGHSLVPHPTATSFDDRKGILLVGAIYGPDTPNGDAFNWFVQEVLPLLVTTGSEPIPVTIAGECTWDDVREMCPPQVRFVGALADLTPLYSSHRMFVAPTRFAAGIPHKVHEAAAFGLPSVVSSLLAEQLGWRSGVEVLAADGAQAFADHVSRVYTNSQLWNQLRAGGLASVIRDCSPEIFERQVAAILSTRFDKGLPADLYGGDAAGHRPLG